MAKKSEKSKKIPKGSVSAADDILLDIESSPPDPDEVVTRINPDGSMTDFPASDLPKSEW